MPKFLFKLLLLLLIAGLFIFFIRHFLPSESSPKNSETETESESAPKKECGLIVLDAGHGGPDPGKVGINNVYEKEINLSVVQKLQPLLEDYGFIVRLTRDSDTILGPANSTQPKKDDMIGRVSLIKELNPYFTISIHQNSFPDAAVSGPQVFYYKDSEVSANMAQIIQNSLNQYLMPSQKRESQANANYYLLTRTPSPTVIVECGFLSNPDEADLLATEEYQQKVAEAICFGIIAYYEANELTSN